MKKIHITIMILMIICSCKKEDNSFNDSGFLHSVERALKDSLSTNDFSTLDFDKAVLIKVDSIHLYCLRIPIIGKDLMNDFVIVKTNLAGRVKNGNFIHIEGKVDDNNKWNGRITIASLNKQLVFSSNIKDGYVMSLHPFLNEVTSRLAVVYPDPYVDMPEVTVVAYINNSGGISYAQWVALQTLYNDYGSGGGDLSGYYTPLDGGSGMTTGSTGGYSSSGTTSSTSVQTSPVINIDFESQYANPAINLSAYLKCFSNIPDAGATCTIKILTDIPVDNDPNDFFDWSNGSPGHTFIQLEKVNGSQLAFQNIGFYPKTGWKTVLTNAPIDGKFVDNGGHEYNASLQMTISPSQLQSAINEILYLGRFVKYDIDEYNCTDWALEVFNYVRNSANQLIIPKFDLPNGEAPNGSNTPEGLYIKLQQMKKNNSPEANNVSIGFKKAFVGSSSGPCN